MVEQERENKRQVRKNKRSSFFGKYTIKYFLVKSHDVWDMLQN